ncbi:30S ribosomal protein S16 [Candidatus Kaiserbacteria bacterium]|nr:30S ribosomal protein S16 [Candidatus Kaiserbacteria bacterium]
MLVIRLQRTGRTNDPAFRVVVCEHTIGPKAGKYLEKLGSYNPKTKHRVLDQERITYWMSQGAKPSETMHNMFVSEGILKTAKINVLPKRKILAKREQAKKVAADQAAPEAAKNAPKKEEAPAAATEA